MTTLLDPRMETYPIIRPSDYAFRKTMLGRIVIDNNLGEIRSYTISELKQLSADSPILAVRRMAEAALTWAGSAS
jgi:uncharacterized protein YbjQ (UPF0145 family)